MPCRQQEEVRVQCYSSGKGWIARIAGYLLIAAGAVLILLCVPMWAWLAAIGAVLILLGLFIAKK